MKPKPIRKMSPIGEPPRIVGPPAPEAISRIGQQEPRSFNSFGASETHRITVIDLKPEDRAAFQNMAKRYRVKSLIHFLEGCLSAEEKRTYRASQTLFRVYED